MSESNRHEWTSREGGVSVMNKREDIIKGGRRQLGNK